MSFTVAAVVGAGVGLAKLGMSLSGRKKRIQEQEAAKKEMEAKKKAYEALDTSNPYANLENKMEDRTVDQRAAEFASQKEAQNRANIMQQMKGAAGASGIAALAQQMAQSGQLASQKAAADIGRQEQANQAAAQAEASKLQSMEAQGERESQKMEQDKQATLLGMAQQRKAAADQARADATAQQMSAIGDIGSAATTYFTGGQNLGGGVG